MTVPRALLLPCTALLATALLASMSSRLSAQNTLTESDQKRILDRLENLHKTSLEVKFGRYSQALAAFQAAAESPSKSYDFYVDCYKLVNFDQQGKKAAEYREWRERNIKRVRATEHQKMLQFQLRYLVMTIRALHMEDRLEIIPQLQGFIQAAVDEYDGMGEEAIGLKQSVTATIFAKAYEIDLQPATGSSLGWEMAPLNLKGQFDKLFLPALRESGNTKGLENAWNRRIEWEIALMAPEEDPKKKDDFVKDTLPDLQWAKWLDIAENGERARAANAMLELIEKNLQHPSAENWISVLVNTVRGGTVSDEDFEDIGEPETSEPVTQPAPIE